MHALLEGFEARGEIRDARVRLGQFARDLLELGLPGMLDLQLEPRDRPGLPGDLGLGELQVTAELFALAHQFLELVAWEPAVLQDRADTGHLGLEACKLGLEGADARDLAAVQRDRLVEA